MHGIVLKVSLLHRYIMILPNPGQADAQARFDDHLVVRRRVHVI